MQVLENNFKQKEFEITCPHCKSKLKYDEGDIESTFYHDAQYITCPCCMAIIYLDDDGNIIPDEDEDIERNPDADHYIYPDDFWHFSKNEHAVAMDDEWVRSTIEECIRHIRECEDPDDAYYWEIGTGDTMVIVQRHEGDKAYEIIVAKDFYELELPFTDKDYGQWKNY